MEIYETGSPAEAYELSRMLLAGQEGVIVVRSVGPAVWTGRLSTFDAEYCAEHGIPVAYGEYIGGSIVTADGDLSVMWITYGKNDYARRAADAMLELLRIHGISAEIDGNDVLADGKKVASWAGATTTTGWYQGAFHASVGLDPELIRRICTKPMEKTPGALSQYGIDAEKILHTIDPIVYHL